MGEHLIKPFLDLLIEREARTTGDESAAKDTVSRSKQVAKDIEAELKEARVEGIALRDAQVAKAREEGGKVIAASEEKAEAKLEEARAEIASMLERETANVEKEAEDLGLSLFESAKKPSVPISQTRH